MSHPIFKGCSPEVPVKIRWEKGDLSLANAACAKTKATAVDVRGPALPNTFANRATPRALTDLPLFTFINCIKVIDNPFRRVIN